MTNSDIARLRMWNQHICQHPLHDPVKLVSYLGAVQAQDYGGAKWALGLRLSGITEGEIECAVRDGELLRTHILRPTWHFVTPADIRWMLELSAPRIKTAMGYGARKVGLDEAAYRCSNELFTKALRGGNYLTRAELGAVLREAGIATHEQRLAYMATNAELDGIICSGPRKGKQFTYALLDERAPRAKKLPRDESLAELARRYFISRGPATLQDYIWWSGLRTADARAGIAANGSHLKEETVDGRTYWMAKSQKNPKYDSPLATLIPVLDEYIIGYTDRSAVMDASAQDKLIGDINVLFTYMILIDGQVVGSWKRSGDGRAIRVNLKFLRPLNAAEKSAVEAAMECYRDYLCQPVMARTI